MSASIDAPAVFDVLFVCTGNICRSPMAELILAARIAELVPADREKFRVHSAGTYGLTGYPIDTRAARAISELGIGSDEFRSRDLSDTMLADADVILTATRDHRAAAVTMSPRIARRTFTIREFGRLCEGVDPAALPGEPVDRAREIVRAAAGRRGLVPVSQRDDEIADPYGARQADFASTLRLIEDSLQPFLQLLHR